MNTKRRKMFGATITYGQHLYIYLGIHDSCYFVVGELKRNFTIGLLVLLDSLQILSW